ncbi:hypothetical protein HMY34_08355 [Thiothrix subterranea]|uniref:amidase domain-containing protein n=1 Tax=Thiothrix subterranea TaxID=2735563 RepID=UPI00192C5B26|nr:amidase domain-containing protein [Thiothrix subterranea]QQZ28764.1 hypothetical protein HMY34_08355 [Thiothrix subterranea]
MLAFSASSHNHIIKKCLLTLLPLGFCYIAPAHAESYTATTAKSYATSHYSKSYGTGTSQNPFPNVSDVGGNCTNFGNQVISSGLLSKTTPKSLNDALVKDKKFPSSTRKEWFFGCNSVGNTCQSPSWRGAQSMFVFSRDQSNGKALRMAQVTKTALVNGKLTPLDHTKVKVGDIIFADFNFSTVFYGNDVDHTMIVTEVKPLSWWNIIQKSKYNAIRLTYQTSNSTDRGLGDIWSENSGYFWWSPEPAFYVYRPSEYRR